MLVAAHPQAAGRAEVAHLGTVRAAAAAGLEEDVRWPLGNGDDGPEDGGDAGL